MKSILAIAAGVLAACTGSGGPVSPASAIFDPASGREAQLYARYQQYRTGPPPHLDFESWKRLYGVTRDSGSRGP